MHADRTNRLMLLLFSVLLIAAGGLAGAASLGAFGSGVRHRRLTDNETAAFIGRNGAWLWPAAAVVAAVIVVLALRWLLALLFTTDRTGDLSIATRTADDHEASDREVAGRTTLSAGALTAAVVAEIESYRGVQSARARVLGHPTSPSLAVVATLADSADPDALRKRIETGALTHARQAVGDPSLPLRLDLTVGTRRMSRTA